jgi:hypothetical protein
MHLGGRVESASAACVPRCPVERGRYVVVGDGRRRSEVARQLLGVVDHTRIRLMQRSHANRREEFGCRRPEQRVTEPDHLRALCPRVVADQRYARALGGDGGIEHLRVGPAGDGC